MKILFDPAPPFLRCCVFQNGGSSVHLVKLQKDWAKTVMGHLAPHADLEAVGYILHNGGKRFKEAATLLSGQSLEKIRQCVPFLPEHNSMTLNAAEFWMKERPDARHILLCDTAFFTRLPRVAHNYAIPYELTRNGLGRYGAFGLCHEWIWRQTLAQTSAATKNVISIYLGDHSSLAAICDGIPQETTTGLTSLEGVMSSGGCGDIDPTVVFLLKAAGLSHSAINRILCNESGFAALGGGPCTLGDILGKPSNPGFAAAARILRYQIVKQIGAMLALLGRVDVLSFACQKPQNMIPFINEICEELEFLGVRCRPERDSGIFFRELSSPDSAVKIIVHRYDRWAVMEEGMESLKYNRGNCITQGTARTSLSLHARNGR